MGQFGKICGLFMCQRLTLRTEINYFGRFLRVCFGFFNCCLKRRRHHNHSRTTSEGAIIDIAKFVVGKFSGINGLKLPKVLFSCPACNTIFDNAVEHLWKNGDGLNQHQ